jgi:hypothetical protein
MMVDTRGRKCNAWQRRDDGERHGAVNGPSIAVTGRHCISVEVAAEMASGGAG